MLVRIFLLTAPFSGLVIELMLVLLLVSFVNVTHFSP